MGLSKFKPSYKDINIHKYSFGGQRFKIIDQVWAFPPQLPTHEMQDVAHENFHFLWVYWLPNWKRAFSYEFQYIWRWVSTHH